MNPLVSNGVALDVDDNLVNEDFVDEHENMRMRRMWMLMIRMVMVMAMAAIAVMRMMKVYFRIIRVY